jgi:hypothetical protein
MFVIGVNHKKLKLLDLIVSNVLYQQTVYAISQSN